MFSVYPHLCFVIILVFTLTTTSSISTDALVRSKRMLNGNPVPDGKFPFMAALVSGPYVIDGATVVTSEFVLTSCHAVRKMEWINFTDPYVYLGHVHLRTKDSKYGFGIKKKICHPGYNRSSPKDDIALLQLTRRIDFDGEHKFVRPACVPLTESKAPNYEPSKCVAMGWGETSTKADDFQSEQLLESNMPVLQNNSCVNDFHYDPERMICAGQVGGQSGTCVGDAGGPLACPIEDKSGRFCVVGVATALKDMCFYPGVGVFTKVHYYAEWLKKNTEMY